MKRQRGSVDDASPDPIEIEVVGADGKALKTCATPGKLPPFVRGLIKDWWYNRGAYKEIEDMLAASGYSVPRSVLTEWADRQWPDAIPVIEEFGPEFLAMTPEKQAIHLLWAKAAIAIREIRSYRAYAMNNLLTMANAVSKIASTQATLDRIEQDKMKAGGDTQKIIGAAKEQLMAEARKVLEQRPDLLKSVDAICTVFEEAEGNIKLLN